jgi:hypothetical protein
MRWQLFLVQLVKSLNHPLQSTKSGVSSIAVTPWTSLAIVHGESKAGVVPAFENIVTNIATQNRIGDD